MNNEIIAPMNSTPFNDGQYPTQPVSVELHTGNSHPLRKVIALGAAATIGVAGTLMFIESKPKSTSTVEVTKSTITAVTRGIEECFADIYTDNKFDINQENHIDYVPKNPFWTGEYHWHNNFPAEVPGYVKLCLPGEAVRTANITKTLVTNTLNGRSKTRSSTSEVDKVSIAIDRRKLFIGAADVLTSNVEGQPNTMTVSNDKEVAEDNIAVPAFLQQEVIAKNGVYNLGTLRLGGKDSDMSSFMETLHLGQVNYAHGSHTAELAYGELLLMNPSCIQAVERTSPLDQIVGTGFKNMYTQQGILPAHIHISETGQWPAAGDIPNNFGQTYNEKIAKIGQAMKDLGNISIKSHLDCSIAPGMNRK